MKIRLYLLATQGMSPVAALTLADFKVNIYSVNKSTAAVSQVVTDAAMGFEVGNGIYGYHYSTGIDFETYDYVGCVTYDGSTILDSTAYYHFGGFDLLDEMVEGSISTRKMLRILLARMAGKASGGGTANIKFRDLADTKDRIDMTVDSAGNRSAVTLDGS